MDSPNLPVRATENEQKNKENGILMRLENENEEGIDEEYGSGQEKLFKEEKRGTFGGLNEIFFVPSFLYANSAQKQRDNKLSASDLGERKI